MSLEATGGGDTRQAILGYSLDPRDNGVLQQDAMVVAIVRRDVHDDADLRDINVCAIEAFGDIIAKNHKLMSAKNVLMTRMCLVGSCVNAGTGRVAVERGGATQHNISLGVNGRTNFLEYWSKIDLQIGDLVGFLMVISNDEVYHIDKTGEKAAPSVKTYVWSQRPTLWSFANMCIDGDMQSFAPLARDLLTAGDIKIEAGDMVYVCSVGTVYHCVPQNKDIVIAEVGTGDSLRASMVRTNVLLNMKQVLLLPNVLTSSGESAVNARGLLMPWALPMRMLHRIPEYKTAVKVKELRTRQLALLTAQHKRVQLNKVGTSAAVVHTSVETTVVTTEIHAVVSAPPVDSSASLEGSGPLPMEFTNALQTISASVITSQKKTERDLAALEQKLTTKLSQILDAVGAVVDTTVAVSPLPHSAVSSWESLALPPSPPSPPPFSVLSSSTPSGPHPVPGSDDAFPAPPVTAALPVGSSASASAVPVTGPEIIAALGGLYTQIRRLNDFDAGGSAGQPSAAIGACTSAIGGSDDASSLNMLTQKVRDAIDSLGAIGVGNKYVVTALQKAYVQYVWRLRANAVFKMSAVACTPDVLHENYQVVRACSDAIAEMSEVRTIGDAAYGVWNGTIYDAWRGVRGVLVDIPLAVWQTLVANKTSEAYLVPATAGYATGYWDRDAYDATEAYCAAATVCAYVRFGVCAKVPSVYTDMDTLLGGVPPTDLLAFYGQSANMQKESFKTLLHRACAVLSASNASATYAEDLATQKTTQYFVNVVADAINSTAQHVVTAGGSAGALTYDANAQVSCFDAMLALLLRVEATLKAPVTSLSWDHIAMHFKYWADKGAFPKTYDEYMRILRAAIVIVRAARDAVVATSAAFATYDGISAAVALHGAKAKECLAALYTVLPKTSCDLFDGTTVLGRLLADFKTSDNMIVWNAYLKGIDAAKQTAYASNESCKFRRTHPAFQTVEDLVTVWSDEIETARLAAAGRLVYGPRKVFGQMVAPLQYLSQFKHLVRGTAMMTTIRALRNKLCTADTGAEFLNPVGSMFTERVIPTYQTRDGTGSVALGLGVGDTMPIGSAAGTAAIVATMAAPIAAVAATTFASGGSGIPFPAASPPPIIPVLTGAGPAPPATATTTPLGAAAGTGAGPVVDGADANPPPSSVWADYVKTSGDGQIASYNKVPGGDSLIFSIQNTNFRTDWMRAVLLLNADQQALFAPLFAPLFETAPDAKVFGLGVFWSTKSDQTKQKKFAGILPLAGTQGSRKMFYYFNTMPKTTAQDSPETDVAYVLADLLADPTNVRTDRYDATMPIYTSDVKGRVNAALAGLFTQSQNNDMFITGGPAEGVERMKEILLARSQEPG